jgi:hypothetical protein
LAFFLATAAVTGTLAIATSKQARTAIAEVLRDPLSLLAQRSPGARGAGALTQTKGQRYAAATHKRAPAHGPEQRVLSEMRFRPEVLRPDDVLDDLGLPLLVEGDFEPPPSDVFPSGSPPPSGPWGPYVTPSSFGNPPPNDNGSEPPGNTVDPRNPTTPHDPVPEPATWLTMITGFMGVGLMLRRRLSKRAATVQS